MNWDWYEVFLLYEDMKLGVAALLRTVDYKQKIFWETRLKYKTFNTTRACEKSNTEVGMTGACLARQQFCKKVSGEFHIWYSDPKSTHHTIANKKNKKKEEKGIS